MILQLDPSRRRRSRTTTAVRPSISAVTVMMAAAFAVAFCWTHPAAPHTASQPTTAREAQRAAVRPHPNATPRAVSVSGDLPQNDPTTRDTQRANFSLCHSGGGTNCVVDGDTFWFSGQKIRIADIDTPETHGPRCEAEATRGKAATQRMHALLNAGPFTLVSGGRDTDRYGRALRIVTRDGESLGGVLVDEGLARWYGGGRKPWC